MKKFMLMAAVALMTAFFMYSCSKDEDPAPTSLVGTSWKATYGTAETIWSFISDSKCKETYCENGKSESWTWTYSYASGVITTDAYDGDIRVYQSKITHTLTQDGITATMTYYKVTE